MLKRRWFALALALLVVAETALGALTDVSTFCASYPYVCDRGTLVMLTARGEGTNSTYVLEVDTTTGALPVDATLAVDYQGTPGAAAPSKAAYVGGTDGTNLRGLKTDSSGELQVDVLSSALPTGAATAANQSTANTSLSTIAGAVSGSEMQVDVVTSALPSGAATAAKQPALGTAGTASSDVLTVQGIASMTPLQVADNGSSLSVDDGGSTLSVDDAGGSLTVDGTVSASNLPATADTNSGAAGASTLRTVLATRHEAAATPVAVRLSDGSAFGNPADKGRSYADSFRNAYASTNVTTGAWVELDSSTAATINGITLFDSCGETLELGTGAAAAETRVLLIPPGGIDGFIPLAIASGTRVAVRAVSGNCTTGELVITGLN